MFKVIIYNILTCNHFMRQYSSAYIKEFFPYLDQMIKLNLFPQIGHRIFKIFKNHLLMRQYLENEDHQTDGLRKKNSRNSEYGSGSQNMNSSDDSSFGY